MSGYSNGGYDGEGGGVTDQNYNVDTKKQPPPSAPSAAAAALSPSELRKEKFRILKNVVVISFSFMLLFTAFQSMANLQSSINKVGYETIIDKFYLHFVSRKKISLNFFSIREKIE